MRRNLSPLPVPEARHRGPEEEALTALRAVCPDLAGQLQPALRQARAIGLGKLWVALAREELGGVRAETSEAQAVLHLPDGSRLIGPPALMDPFAEHRPGLAVEGPGGAVEHPADLLATVGRAASWDKLTEELRESVANHALALVGEARRQHRLLGEAGLGSVGPRKTSTPTAVADGRAGAAEPHGALTWALEQAAADPGFSPLALSEQTIVDGHPLHPCARIRGGMTAGDVLAYAPEWAEEVAAGVVAIAASSCSKPAVPGPSATDLLHRWFPETAAAARAHLARLGTAPDDFELVAVHPWQLERVLPDRYAAALADRSVVIVPGVSIPARPLLSLRTLAPAADRRAPHLKTAVDIRLTTAVRIVSPSAARNGPLMSALVARACHEEQGFGGRFAPLAELAGASYVPAPGEDKGLAASLGMIVRESPERGLGPGQVALPTAALAARSPFSGRPLLADLLGDLSREQGLTPAEAGARFLGAWCECALPPLLTLLSRWGIGLEPHGENLITVLGGGGLPVRTLYRDFGGIRVSPSRLADRGVPPELLARLSGALPTDDEEELHTKFLFPLLETNLGQIVATLVRVGGCDRERLWRIVARCAGRTFAALAATGDAATQVRRDEEAFFAPALRVKAMLRTQLSGTPHDARWVTVPNPVAGGS